MSGDTVQDRGGAPAARRPVLVHLAPLPGSRNGIADYAAAILLRLAQDYQCICVVEQPATVIPAIHQVAKVISFEEYQRVAPDLKGERHLCHVGNNANHVRILDSLSEMQSVVVLHDLTLHYLMECWAQNYLGGKSSMRHITGALHGRRGAELVRAKHEDKVPVQCVYTELNGLPVFNDNAQAMIVHSQHGRVLLTAAGYEQPVHVVPHFAEVPDPALKARRRARWRASLGATPETVVLSSLGFVVPNKCIDTVLRTLAALPKGMPPWLYVIGGEIRDPSVPATCEALGLGGNVVFLDYLKDEDFDSVLCASDAVINLRFPTSGETSGTVCRALAHGVPSIVNDHGWYAELPDSITYKVPPGPDMTADIRAALIYCLLDRDARQRKGGAAEDFALRHMALDNIVSAYRDVIEQAHAATWRPPARRAHPAVVLPPQRKRATLGDSDPERLLFSLLEDEVASPLDGGYRAIVVPTAGPAIAAIARGDGDAETFTGLTQAFAAIEATGAMGGMILAVADAWHMLKPGDLLTLAVLSDMPDQAPPEGWITPPGRHPWNTPRLLDQLGTILVEAGFTIMRSAETPVAPATPSDVFGRILIATARKLGDAAPLPAWFDLNSATRPTPAYAGGSATPQRHRRS